jgi:hypothetical protein
MLIDKGVSAGEVITLKLTSGEEIIGRLAEDSLMFVKLSRPLVVGMSPKGPALMPYLFTVSPSKDVKIQRSSVVVIEATDKEFADQYIQSTTGIQLA